MRETIGFVATCPEQFAYVHAPSMARGESHQARLYTDDAHVLQWAQRLSYKLHCACELRSYCGL